eukprot:21138-Heterococcus_DN1.PRE.6
MLNVAVRIAVLLLATTSTSSEQLHSHTELLQSMLYDGMLWAEEYGVRITSNRVPSTTRARFFITDHAPVPLGACSVSKFFQRLVQPSVPRNGHVYFVMTGSCTGRAWLGFREVPEKATMCIDTASHYKCYCLESVSSDDY